MAPSLERLGPGVHAWLNDTVDHDSTNIGVVIGDDGFTVIDAGLTPQHSTLLVEELSRLAPYPIRRLLLTGSHIDVVGGSSAFPLPAVYGSAQTSDHLDQPANHDVWARLHPHYASELADVVTRPVTHTVTEAAHLCPASIAVPVAGSQFENLVVQVPSVNVVFVGAAATFSLVPLAFEADLGAWVGTLDALLGMGELFVPSHGPIGGVEEVVTLRNYLEACIDAGGVLSRMAEGPWDTWGSQHFTPINVERAFMLASGDPSPPPSMLALVGMG